MSPEKAIPAREVIMATVKFFENTLEKVARVIEVSKASDGWDVRVEALEESEYMRKFGRGDLLGIYEVKVDKDLNVISYNRKGLRERASLEEK
ncbi:gas vesicle protein [bacterium]|nr:gas vesicle protein [bacterium]MCG2676974.1 gas vesicle protein [bacterium]